MSHREVVQRTRPRIPGLQGIENLSDAEKTARITMITDDMISAITQIARMKRFGTLNGRNTRPIDDMIDTFARTDGTYRRDLEHLIEKREQSLETLNRRHKEDMEGLVRSAAHGVSRLTQRAQVLEQELRVTKQQLADRELRCLAAAKKSERRNEDERRSEGKRMAGDESEEPGEED